MCFGYMASQDLVKVQSQQLWPSTSVTLAGWVLSFSLTGTIQLTVIQMLSFAHWLIGLHHLILTFDLLFVQQSRVTTTLQVHQFKDNSPSCCLTLLNQLQLYLCKVQSSLLLMPWMSVVT